MILLLFDACGEHVGLHKTLGLHSVATRDGGVLGDGDLSQQK